MHKNGNYSRILNLIKEKPMSQSEIRGILGRDKISLQGVSKHLKRLVDKREIGYFGNTSGRLYPKMLLMKEYKRKWPENAQRYYFHTPEAGKLHRKLIRRYKKKNKDLIDEVTRLYRALEVGAKFQEMHAPKDTQLRKDIIEIYKKRNEIVKIDSNNKEFLGFIKIIKMDPIMFKMAYREEETRNAITIPMFKKMGELFVRVKNKTLNEYYTEIILIPKYNFLLNPLTLSL